MAWNVGITLGGAAKQVPILVLRGDFREQLSCALPLGTFGRDLCLLESNRAG